jgi:MoaD family protein
MVVVTVEYLLKFKSITGKDKEEIVLDKGATVKDVIDLLYKRYGEGFVREFSNPSGDAIGGRVLILLNGRTLRVPEDLTQLVNDGDAITIMHMVEGG